jgi:hypothetical protein
LAADREEYRKGEEYLAWIRRRWQAQADSVAAPKGAAGKVSPKEPSAQERERDELAGQLRAQGLPLSLPANLDELFATAEGLRQELAGLQLELTPLQRTRQGVRLPGLLWPLLLTLAAAAPSAVIFWLRAPGLIAAAAGGLAALVLVWGIFLVRRSKATGVVADLDRQIGQMDLKKADALARQEELAERFAAFDLPSVPVEMVKLQQLCQRNAGMLAQYRKLCEQLGSGASPAKEDSGDGHLRPEELPEAEAKLASLGESLRRRETHLQALREGGGSAAVVSLPGDALQRQKLLLQGGNQQLDRLTGGRYRELRVEEGQLRLEVAPGRWAAPAGCGRGTAETLKLALRMVLGQLTGARLPLPVDDLPANLDARRLQVAMRTLERFAAEQQVLLASSDEELARRAVRERWTLIDLNQAGHGVQAQDEEGEHVGQLHLL